jgi:hypothetical protein
MSATTPPAAPPCLPGAGRAVESAHFRQFTRWVFWLCLIFGGVMLAAGLRVLYMTHHLASSRSELRRMPRSGFAIEKPFKPNEFLLAVRQALDSMPASPEFHPHA